MWQKLAPEFQEFYNFLKINCSNSKLFFLGIIMMSQTTPKHLLENKILLKLEKKFNSIEVNPNSTDPLSEPSVHFV